MTFGHLVVPLRLRLLFRGMARGGRCTLHDPKDTNSVWLKLLRSAGMQVSSSLNTERWEHLTASYRALLCHSLLIKIMHNEQWTIRLRSWLSLSWPNQKPLRPSSWETLSGYSIWHNYLGLRPWLCLNYAVFSFLLRRDVISSCYCSMQLVLIIKAQSECSHSVNWPNSLKKIEPWSWTF